MAKITLMQAIDALTAQLLLLDRVRRVRTRRGARATRGLMTVTRELERALYVSFDQLRRDLLASVKGRPDDVTTGRLGQSERADPDRVAVMVALIALWRRRQQQITSRFTARLFASGRKKALAELARDNAPGTEETSRLAREVHALYASDLDRLQQALAKGSPRHPGIENLFEGNPSVTDVTAAINALFRAERFRLDLYAESLIWTAFLQGYRAGAVDGAQLALASGEEPATYRWVGPADSLTCAPCLAQFNRPIQARTLADLPLPQSICSYGRSCRHHFSLASG